MTYYRMTHNGAPVTDWHGFATSAILEAFENGYLNDLTWEMKR